MAAERKGAFILSPQDAGRSVFLHCDPEGRPYAHSELLEELQARGVRRLHIQSLHPIRFSNAWLLKMRTLEAKRFVAQIGGMMLHGMYCGIVDASLQEYSIKVHWVPSDMSAEPLRNYFEQFGDVRGVSRVEHKVLGLDGVESTTVIIRMSLKEGVTERDLPHELPLCGTTFLVAVPGRPPFCQRCRKMGHTFSNCHTPKCLLCGMYGHKHHKARHSLALLASSAHANAHLPDVAMEGTMELAKQLALGLLAWYWF
ncbi:hypothetical protein HPB49_007967 [Dermacentor silvarum]|uniref:Uncharacterized protein n=1 Tax=Dermacentor silvarum TaxID=543639 RepID=A0ACB8DXR9_DERSI|nr:hypothetical protein HPB49_007967 [Dermacentor silvarum]